MFNRLKSLPLTIVLTILIWMYAEAQFTSTREGLLVSLNVASPSASYSVRVQDPSDGQYHQTLPIRVTIEGPQNKVDTLQQATRQLGGEGDSLSFPFVPSAATLQAGGDQNFDTASLLNGMPYFRDNGMTVIAASPARLRLDVQPVQTITAPIVFRSPAAPDAQVISVSAGEAKVTLPPQLLTQIGGPSRLTVVATPIHDIGALTPTVAQTISARLTVDYPGAAPIDLVSVSPAQVTVTLRIPDRRVAERTLPGVRVRVLGPPDLFDCATVEMDHPEVEVTLAGPASTLQTLSGQGISAYVMLEEGDDRQVGEQERPVRYQLPEGLRVVKSSPERVTVKLTAHVAASLPATMPATQRATPR